METITSPQNIQIKNLKKLSLSKYRQEMGKFAIENSVIINDALASGYGFESLFVTEDFARRNPEKLGYLKKNCPAARFFSIDDRINRNYSQLDTPSGITAIYKMKDSSLFPGRPVLYLNKVKDPGNLGAIIRTALAFGFPNLVIDEGCADIYNAKTLSAAKDAIFKMNIIEDINHKWIFGQKGAMPIYVTGSHQGAELNNFKPAEIFCLVLGSESHGVSEEIMGLADKTIRIEMSQKIESLNVATAAAIFMYEWRSKNNYSG